MFDQVPKGSYLDNLRQVRGHARLKIKHLVNSFASAVIHAPHHSCKAQLPNRLTLKRRDRCSASFTAAYDKTTFIWQLNSVPNASDLQHNFVQFYSICTVNFYSSVVGTDDDDTVFIIY